MKSVTVFTPTFNRAFCLGQLYESLVSQTSNDFSWMIIDDGSADNTKELVDFWIAENKIDIIYIFQENQGMHGAHNTAYANVTTELNVCIDSDDFMPNDAIEKITAKWNASKSEDVAGIIGLDAYKKDGKIVGTPFPENLKSATLSDLHRKYKVTGDKKLVLRTEVVKKFPPYPIFPTERFVPLGTLYLLIDQQYEYVLSNEIYCIVEYLPDGSSNNILRQYAKSPNGFRYARLVEMKYAAGLSYGFTRSMHFISSSLYSGNYNLFHKNPKKLMTLLAIPFGLAFHAYLLFKNRK